MRIAQTNFTGGEVSPTLSARYDLGRYKNSVGCMENFLPNLHGDVERRPGTVFLAELDGPAFLLPFSFSAAADQNFALVFGDKTLRIADASGLRADVPVIATPYALEHVREISHAQMGDVVYLAHKAYPLHKLTRSGTPPYAWALRPVVFNTSLPAPPAPSVSFIRGNDEDDAPLEYALRYKVVAVDGDGKESLASPAGETTGKHPSDWVTGNHVDLGWDAVAGATEYNIYREEAGYFGFIGVAAGTTFTDNNYEADTADTPREDWDPFVDGNNPGVVAFHQQRLVLAGTPKAPQAFYMSRTGDFENFRKSRPLQDDDPVEYLIASGAIDSITWAASFGDLLLGTSGSEYKASGDGGPITAKNISITAQSYWGSANLSPIIIGNSILHVQRHGARVRDLFYSLEKDGYAGNDLSIMAPHLFDRHRLIQWAYQQTPGSTIWIVRDDGVMLALTYMKEQDIYGWSRQLTAGAFTSVASLSGDDEDVILVVVRRRVNGRERYMLERLASRWNEADIEEAFFVDCGVTRRQTEAAAQVAGLGHLEGEAVAVLADGSPVEGLIVRGGRITLPYRAGVVHVGLPYTATLSPLPFEADVQGTGSTLGKLRTYGRCGLRLHATVGGKYGPDSATLYDLPFVPERWDAPVPPFSGDLEFLPGGGQESQATLWLVQDRPLPLHLVAIMPDVDMGQQ